MFRRQIAIGFAIVGLGTPTSEARVRYVDADATGGNDGLTWTDAFVFLQDALDAADPGDQIWVAEGIYHPDDGVSVNEGDRTATFQLLTGVGIHGGFEGDEETLQQRAGLFDQTILSGDLNDDDDLRDSPAVSCFSNNSYNVVTGSGTDATAILDGFTISGGNAYGDSPYPHNTVRGGGVYINPGSPTLVNCTIRDNCALLQGGGLFNEAETPTLLNCTLTSNRAQYGGGMFNELGGPMLTDCTFAGNVSTSYGGGMYNLGYGATILINCAFTSNWAEWGGGGICSAGSPTVTDTTFIGNSASTGGGMTTAGGSPVLTNCAFVRNSATIGGGMGDGGGTTPHAVNCIFGNSSALCRA